MIEMKHSGIDWIGEIPAHWEVKRLKDISTIVLGKMLMTKSPGAGYTLEKYLKSKNIGRLQIFNSYEDLEEMYFNDFEKEMYLLKNNDIVMNEGGDIGKVALWRNNGLNTYIQNSVNKITVFDGIEPRYLCFFLSYCDTNGFLKSIVNQVSIAHLTKEKLCIVPSLVPPIEEQQAIADYLDEKTTEIDKQVELLDQKQKAYLKLKASLINQVVTRGLNPYAPLRDSEIDWIGEIPAHWEVKRLKDIVTSGSGTTPKSSNEKYYDNGIYPWLITGDVQNNVITSNDIFITDLAVSEVTNLKLFPPKTVLLAMYGGGTIGNVGLMTYPAYINQACCALIPSKNIAEKYLFYYLLNKQKRIISTGVGGTQINLSQNKIVAYPIAIPPIEEQQAIADYLDEKTAEIDNAITNIDKKIKAYKRLKQSLIDEVVTGKRKI